MSYQLYTFSQVLAQTLSLLRQYKDTGDSEWILDRIREAYLLHCRTAETFVPHSCFFEICNQKVTLPFFAGDLMWVDWYETDQETKFGLQYTDEIYAKENFNTNDTDSYWFNSNTIRINTDRHDGKFAKAGFYSMLRNENGEYVIPEIYIKGITRLVAAEFLSTMPSSQNAQIVNRFEAEAINSLRAARGMSNTSNPIQSGFAGRITRGVDTRFMNTCYAY